jgi:ABC-type nitrate/sulfonate/bicarbonate transport system substrate-binding protein
VITIAPWLKANGGYGLKDVRTTELSATDTLVALQSGSVDIAYLLTPFWQQADKGNYAKYIPNTSYSLASYMMSTDFIKQQPDVAKALLRATMRAQRTYLQGDYHADPKALAAMAKATGTPEANLSATPSLRFTSDLIFSKTATDKMMAAQQAWLDAGGILQYDKSLALERMVDNSLAQQVLAGK